MSAIVGAIAATMSTADAPGPQIDQQCSESLSRRGTRITATFACAHRVGRGRRGSTIAQRAVRISLEWR